MVRTSIFEHIWSTAGLVSVSGGNADFGSMILPALTIAIAMSAKYIRQIRHIFLEETWKKLCDRS